MARGVIYILTNPSFPDYVKIGYAKDLEKRMRQLNRSETIPYAFRAYAVYEVDSTLTDRILHSLIDQLNPDLRTIETFDGKERKKEFYAMRPEEAYSLLEAIAKISGTENRLKKMSPEGHEILDEKMAEELAEESRRGSFTFSAAGIKEGQTVCYIHDKSVKAVVVDDKHVKYKDEVLSLTALAKKLLKKKRSVNGPRHFTYKGERLTSLRRRMEK